MNFPIHIVAAAGFIKNETGQILLIRHPRRGWEMPGGQVEMGEDLITAVTREVKEEAGIDVVIHQMAGVYSNVKTGVQYDGVSPMPTKVIFDFIGEEVSGELQTSSESLEVGWFDEDQVLEMVTHPMNYQRVKNLINYDGQINYMAYSLGPELEVYTERKL